MLSKSEQILPTFPRSEAHSSRRIATRLSTLPQTCPSSFSCLLSKVTVADNRRLCPVARIQCCTPPGQCYQPGLWLAGPSGSSSAREKPDQKQEITPTETTYVNGNKKCWLERKSWRWERGVRDCIVRKEAGELLRPYITRLPPVQCKHPVQTSLEATEEARQHEQRLMGKNERLTP